MGVRDRLDRFYTSPKTAAKCIEAIDLSLYSTIIEPSAGSGSFSDLLPSRTLSIDISPASPSVKRANWFRIEEEDIWFDERSKEDAMLVIGNPPFGTRANLAKKFIDHSISVGADTIAFILPDTFSKRTNQTCFPLEWRLIETIELSQEECSFELPSEDGGSFAMNMPCSFYIWTKIDSLCSGIDLRDKIVEQPKQYRFLKRGDDEADFSLNGNNGKTKDLTNITNPKAEHYIKVSDGFDPEKIRHIFDSIDFDFRSSVSGGAAWISQNDINKAFLQKTSEMGISTER